MKISIMLTIIIVSLFFNLASFSVLMDNEDEIAELKHKVDWMEDDRNLYQQSAIYWQEKCEHYQTANEALLKYATPASVNRAIKATPLPKMKG